MRIDNRRFAALVMLPAVVFMLAFVGWPVMRLVFDSLYDIQAIGDQRDFVGFSNYTDALGSPAFRAATLRTVVYTLLVVSAEFVLGLAAALLFSALGRRSTIFRTVFLYPLMIAPVVAGLLWRFLLSDNFGILNHLLFRMGLISSPSDIGWLSDTSIVLFAIALPDIWLATSFVTLILYAGLQNIPGELLEAARLDGARRWRLLTSVIMPLIRPMIGVALIVRGVDAAKAFDIILIQTGGGPRNASETLSLLIYQTTLRFGEPGLASAMSVLYLIGMMIVAAIAVKTIWKPGAQ